MENKINIAEILKDKPEGTKLWTDIFGSVTLYIVTDACDAFQVKHHNKEPWFDKEGKLCKEGVLCIYPSNSMRDWSKFAWKKGDVLTGNNGTREVLFHSWVNDSYTKFVGLHCMIAEDVKGFVYDEGTTVFNTNDFKCIEEEYAVQCYINTIEERLGGKLNRETLEIEKTQPKFKDGDIITIKLSKGGSLIGVFKAENDKKYYLHANLDSRGIITISEDSYCKKSTCIARLSTEEEKLHFFDALAKKGRTWDAVKKQIVDLKQKWIPKPFNRVITRNAADDIWTANIFSHMDSHGEYVTIACVGGYTHCLPYNEETAKLIGTTNNWEG